MSVVAACMLATGCGGGSTAAVPGPPRTTSVGRAFTALRVVIPRPGRTGTAMLRRKPRYVSPSTQGLGVSYRASATAASAAAAFPNPTTPLVTLDLSAQSAICTVQPDGSRVCSLTFSAPAGTDDFQIDAWDSPATAGSFAAAHRLSTQTLLNQPIETAKTTTLSLTLDGIVAGIALALSPSALTASDSGTPQTATLAVNAEDTDGNFVVGNGSFVDANGDALSIAIHQSAVGPGSPLRTSFVATALTPQASTLAITYLGGASSGTRFQAVAGSGFTGTVIPATLAIVPRATVTEFALTAGSTPTGIAAGSDGALWFVGYGSGNLMSMSTAGAVVQTVAVAGTSQAGESIVSGPDGNLWFAVDGSGEIERVTTAGVVTAFSSGISHAPYAITKGPDGALWFTEDFHDTVGRITTAGGVTEFTSGITSGAFPYAITTGSDGNLWFTEAGRDAVARITPAGVVTELTGITAGASPFGIASGPDGGVWFCEFGLAKIGRIDPATGAVTEFPIGSGEAPRDITEGPDGAMWFTLTSSDTIGRIDATGNVTQYQSGITPGANPNGITLGPDGNLWFTEESGNRIGRLLF